MVTILSFSILAIFIADYNSESRIIAVVVAGLLGWLLAYVLAWVFSEPFKEEFEIRDFKLDSEVEGYTSGGTFNGFGVVSGSTEEVPYYKFFRKEGAELVPYKVEKDRVTILEDAESPHCKRESRVVEGWPQWLCIPFELDVSYEVHLPKGFFS